MAAPARNIRNVETSENVARPRDAAIRQAANDNRKNYTRYTSVQKMPSVLTYENDNSPSNYQTVNESFNEYASERTIQPTNQTSTTRNARVDYQKSSSAKSSSKAQVLTSAVRSRNPKLAKPSFKRAIPNVPILDVNPVKLARATTVSVSNLSWGIGLWFGIQLPIAVIGIALFGVTYIMYDVVPGMVESAVGETIAKGIGWITDKVSSAVASAVESVFGFNLLELLNPANYFMMAHMLVFVIGLATLILCGIIYQISMVNCIFGKKSTLKIGALIFATFGYLIPVLNIIPWFVFWVLVVWRYPE